MNHLLACKCGEIMWKSVDGTTKLRSKIVIFRNGSSYAVCKGCGAELPVPVALDQFSLSKSRNPKLLLTKVDPK